MQKNILYLSYDGLTDALGQSQILPYVIGLSQKFGYRFTIISAEKKENFNSKKQLIESQIKDLPIDWKPIFYYKKPPVLSTLCDLWAMYRKAVALHKEQNFHLVHCRSYLVALIGEKFTSKFQVPFLFDMRGFWADERVDGELWNLKNPLYRSIYCFFKKKEKDFLRKAAHTISLTYNAREEIRSWKDFENIPISVIPCCVDTDLFSQNGEITPHLKEQTLTISYLGSIGTWYMLKEMLVFFKMLLQSYPKARFLFITAENPQIILKEAKKLNLPLTQIEIRKAERREVPAFIAESQLSVFFIKDSYSKKASSATKMAEILAMGVPIITNKIGDNAFLFEKYDYGYLLEDLSAESMQKAIAHIPKLLQKPVNSLRAIANDYFSLEKGIAEYRQIYEQIFQEKSTH